MNRPRQVPLYAAYRTGDPVKPGDEVCRRRKDRDLYIHVHGQKPYTLRPTGEVLAVTGNRAIVRWRQGPVAQTTLSTKRIALVRREGDLFHGTETD